MGRQIIKQPDGKFAVYSSVIDGFVLINATPDELIAEFDAADHRRNSETVRRVIGQIEAGDKPYYQFTMSWEEALKEHESRHGKLSTSERSDERR